MTLDLEGIRPDAIDEKTVAPNGEVTCLRLWSSLLLEPGMGSFMWFF